jgi:phosphate transport system substrate-binding protein
LNPGLRLPALDIIPVYRADGSGTTALFTASLAGASPVWGERVGSGANVRWPAGLGAKGSEGLTAQVASLTGTIGYVELAYAANRGLGVAMLRNGAGHFVSPTPSAVAAATASAVVTMPDDLRAPFLEGPAAEAYPIVSLTYILVRAQPGDSRRARELALFLWWGVHQGQAFAPALGYVPLPAPLVSRIEGRLRILLGGHSPLAEAS